MTGIDFVIFWLITYSLTYGWIESVLFVKIRILVANLHENLVNCFHCVGFYAGILAGIFYFGYTGISSLAFYGLLGSGLSLVTDKIMLAIDTWVSSRNVG